MLVHFSDTFVKRINNKFHQLSEVQEMAKAPIESNTYYHGQDSWSTKIDHGVITTPRAPILNKINSLPD